MNIPRLIADGLRALLVVYLLSMMFRSAWQARRLGAGRAAAIRLGAGLLLVGAALAMAFAVEQGHAGADGSSFRTAWVLGMMAMLILGILLATSVIGLQFDPDPSILPYRLMGGVFLGAAILLALVLGSVWAGRRFGVYYQRPLFAGAAVIIIALTLTRPWWYWGHWRARQVRAVLGDRGTILFYLALAAVALGFAWAGPWVRNVDAKVPDLREAAGVYERCLDINDAATGAALARVAYRTGVETGAAFLVPSDSGLGQPRVGRWGRDPVGALHFYFVDEGRADRLTLTGDAPARHGRYDGVEGVPVISIDATERACRVEVAGGSTD